MKKVYYLLSSIVIIAAITIACEESSIIEIEDNQKISINQDVTSPLRKDVVKVSICHYDDGQWRSIEVNENAVDAHLAHGDYIGSCSEECNLVFYQGFDTDTYNWFDEFNDWYGTITRVPFGKDDIFSYANFEGYYGPFTRFDGYRDVWPGAWKAEIDIYLDPNWGQSEGFDYSVAANGSDNAHQRDFIFHVNKDLSTGKLLVSGSNNSGFAPREDLESLNHFEVTAEGWYTFQHVFSDVNGQLSVDLNLLDSSGEILFTETRTASEDQMSEIGGNRYGWFTFINVEGGIKVDESKLLICNQV